MLLRLTPVCLCLAAAQAVAQAPAYQCTQPTGGDANRPHPVCEVKAVFTHGPYLSAPTDTSATITWMTNLPSHSKVVYGIGGQLDNEVVPAKHGMALVGTLHAVRLTGLKPGQTYAYRVVSTPVLELTSYWPKKGLETE